MSSDEFIMLGNEEIFEDILTASKNYEKRFKELLPFAKEHHFNFRLGRYLIEKDETDLNEIIAKTNLAHAVAKSEKREGFTDYDSRQRQRLITVSDITNKADYALKHNEFKVYLQCKNSLKDGSVIGAEALVRWIREDGSFIFPGDFISVFESNGFIATLDKYMLDKVCEILRNWIDSGYNCIPIAVNFSRANLKNPNLINDIKQITDKWNIPRNYIEIELTESVSDEEQINLEELLSSLHEEGFRVSLDDFGSGYSSLGMLKNLKIDTLKLDRSFFTNQHNKDRGNIVVEGFVNLAHSLGMYVVAEGIEEQEQVDFLNKIDCDGAQGYFFAKPIDHKQFEQNYLQN